jgi:hypothetical protein
VSAHIARGSQGFFYEPNEITPPLYEMPVPDQICHLVRFSNRNGFYALSVPRTLIEDMRWSSLKKDGYFDAEATDRDKLCLLESCFDSVAEKEALNLAQVLFVNGDECNVSVWSQSVEPPSRKCLASTAGGSQIWRYRIG